MKHPINTCKEFKSGNSSIQEYKYVEVEKTQDGVSQLAGGELVRAVDTQKLYIGNGAVREGALQLVTQNYQQKQILLILQINMCTTKTVPLY